MLVQVHIQHEHDAWNVYLTDGTGEQIKPGGLTAWPRRLTRVPDPQVGETASFPWHAELRNLKPQELSDLHEAFVTHSLRGKQLETLGKYLLDVLLGQTAWCQLVAAAKDSLNLSLIAAHDDTDIHRLPWEVAHDGQGFLAAQPGVSIYRCVAVTPGRNDKLEGTPRVLFVLGSSDLNDASIRSGAEYLGVLRLLERRGLYLSTHLLLRATREQLEATVKAFRPTVVHFICHGWNKDGRGSLQLIDKDRPKTADDVSARSLLNLLRAGGKLPAVVVLNACYTATTGGRIGQAATPLAVELVRGDAEGGVPIVLGMGGEISDQACRLFARRFYESLLEDGDVVRAACEGRRFGIRHGTDPLMTSDWALPTLFVSDQTRPQRFDTSWQPLMSQWHGQVRSYFPEVFPPFADRLELLQGYDRLMMDADQTLDELPQLILAIFSDFRSDEDGDWQFGRTWLLKELAAQAVRHCHLPVLMSPATMGDSWTCSFEEFLEKLQDSVLQAAIRFGLDKWSWNMLPQLLSHPSNSPAPGNWPIYLANYYNIRKKPKQPRVVGLAIREDLQQLVVEARRALPTVAGGCKVLLLFDDVHKLGDAGLDLLNGLLHRDVLWAARQDIRAAFTFQHDPRLTSEVRRIQDWLDNASHVRQQKLDIFSNTQESLLAYRTLLLHWRENGRPTGRCMPLAIRAQANEDDVRALFGDFEAEVQNIPGRLVSRGKTVINIHLRSRHSVLRVANDADCLQAELHPQEG